MAWAARHGLVLYRDVINMNWPGCIVVHMLGQSLTGMDASGVRFVEVVFLWIQCLATCRILRAYHVAAPFRIASVTCCLVTYFAAGPWETAQRESFMTPCLAVALVPLLGVHREGQHRGGATWFVAGAFAAFGASIKPTIVLPIGGAALVTLILWPGVRRSLWLRFASYAVGAAAVFVAMLGFLALRGDLRGFYRWGVQFTFGPYGHLRHPDRIQMERWIRVVAQPAVEPTLRFCVAGVAVLAIVVGASAVRIWRSAPGRAVEVARDAERILQAILLVCLLGLTIYIQGKTHCRYHYIPLLWALSLLGATLLGGSLPHSSDGPWPMAVASQGSPQRRVCGGHRLLCLLRARFR